MGESECHSVTRAALSSIFSQRGRASDFTSTRVRWHHSVTCPLRASHRAPRATVFVTARQGKATCARCTPQVSPLADQQAWCEQQQKHKNRSTGSCRELQGPRTEQITTSDVRIEK